MGDTRVVPKVLAHVMVHGTTHILEGLERHSDNGVMKAHWTNEDIASMARKQLSFDPSDLEYIRLGLSRR